MTRITIKQIMCSMFIMMLVFMGSMYDPVSSAVASQGAIQALEIDIAKTLPVSMEVKCISPTVGQLACTIISSKIVPLNVIKKGEVFQKQYANNNLRSGQCYQCHSRDDPNFSY